MSNKDHSIFEFVQSIIDQEQDEGLKDLLCTIKKQTMDAERQVAMNHDDQDYSQCIRDADAACDSITYLFMQKMLPEDWDRLTRNKKGELKKSSPGKHDIWITEHYSEKWETDQSDLSLFIELFDLKGEANHAKHRKKNEYDRPKLSTDEEGKASLVRKANGELEMDEEKGIAEPAVYSTLQNSLRRLRNLFDFLCAVLVKCGYDLNEEKPSYKEPKRKIQISEETATKIDKLDEIVEKVDSYLAYAEKEDNPIPDQDRDPNNNPDDDDRTKTLKKIIAIAAIILLLLVGLIVVNKLRSPNAGLTSSKGASVYYSKIIPYTESGKYESYASSSDVSDHLETDKAVALLSFIKNEAPDAAVVEDITCKFEEIEEIVEPNIKTDAVLVDNVLKIYVMNDGNGDSSAVSVDIYGDGLALDDYTSENLKNEIEGLQPGEIVEIAEYSLLSEEFIKQNVEEIKIVVKLNDNISEVITILYDPVEDTFTITGGIGDSGADITLFSVLDVDAEPSSISFNPEKITTIEDALRIETVLAPTKSCKIKFKGSYTVDGNTEETETYTATVTVPIYRDGAFGRGGELTNELANDTNNSKAHVKQVAQKYLYDPEALNPQND